MARSRRGRLLITLCVIAVALVGFGIYSDSPRFCASCHTAMGSHFESWGSSSHSRVAVCADCHIHPGWVGFLEGKFRGMRNSIGYLLGREWEGGETAPGRADCLRGGCHVVTEISSVDGAAGAAHERHAGLLDCVSCHEGVGHVPEEESIARDCSECHGAE